MPCQSVRLTGGQFAIVCTGRRSSKPRCSCNRVATLECDWKVPSRKSGTCDKPICSRCTLSPAPDKDICPEHQGDYHRWLKSKGDRLL